MGAIGGCACPLLPGRKKSHQVPDMHEKKKTWYIYINSCYVYRGRLDCTAAVRVAPRGLFELARGCIPAMARAGATLNKPPCGSTCKKNAKLTQLQFQVLLPPKRWTRKKYIYIIYILHTVSVQWCTRVPGTWNNIPGVRFQYIWTGPGHQGASEIFPRVPWYVLPGASS